MSIHHHRLGFIGAGHITAIVVERLVTTATVAPEGIIVSNRNPVKADNLHRRFDVHAAADNAEVVRRSDTVLIAVPPQAVARVVAELDADLFTAGPLVVSLAAGIPLAAYRPWGADLPVARCIPTPPSRIGCGVVALALNARAAADRRQALLNLLTPLGEVFLLEERHLDTVTALSSPAPVYLFFQALVDGAMRCGLDRDRAVHIAARTISGSLALWRHAEAAPADLIAQASTPGGVSAESLFVLEKHGLREAVADALAKGAERAAHLGRRASADIPGR